MMSSASLFKKKKSETYPVRQGIKYSREQHHSETSLILTGQAIATWLCSVVKSTALVVKVEYIERDMAVFVQ